jgi:hypothetical protein
MIFNLLTDSFFVAICLSIWRFGRKYGTVWYHPASSNFLSNYFSSFVSFRKIDSHASDLPRVLSQHRSACCVLGVGADFASTHFNAISFVFAFVCSCMTLVEL